MDHGYNLIPNPPSLNPNSIPNSCLLAPTLTLLTHWLCLGLLLCVWVYCLCLDLCLLPVFDFDFDFGVAVVSVFILSCLWFAGVLSFAFLLSRLPLVLDFSLLRFVLPLSLLKVLRLFRIPAGLFLCPNLVGSYRVLSCHVLSCDSHASCLSYLVSVLWLSCDCLVLGLSCLRIVLPCHV